MPLTFNEKLTLIALVLGPVSAVLITLWIEGRRKTQERRLQILRMLLSTRLQPGDPQYLAAINLTPAEFNDSKGVMAAWKTYQEVVAINPVPVDRARVAQAALIFQISKSVGLQLSEGDIQIGAYYSNAAAERDRIQVASLTALPEIATAMKAQVEHTKELLDRIPRGTDQG